jgi:hypothetical protein
MYISINSLGSVVLDVNGPRLDAVFLGPSGTSLDHFTILKGGGQPPAAPDGLAALAVTQSEIDLTWNDRSNDETGFVVERSPDGAAWTPVAITGADVTSLVDGGLSPLTTYHYRVLARNGFGDSSPSNVATATTLGFEDLVAIGETIVSGTPTGTFTSTWSADGVYESIQEVETQGRNRVNSLEVVWRFDSPGGAAATLFVKAFQSRSKDGDNFVFDWSADGSIFSNLLVVSRRVDDGTYQSASLPSAAAGTVYIRARDTSRKAGARGKDSLRVDHLFIRMQ